MTQQQPAIEPWRDHMIWALRDTQGYADSLKTMPLVQLVREREFMLGLEILGIGHPSQPVRDAAGEAPFFASLVEAEGIRRGVNLVTPPARVWLQPN